MSSLLALWFLSLRVEGVSAYFGALQAIVNRSMSKIVDTVTGMAVLFYAVRLCIPTTFKSSLD
ncbi:hypothetical protein BDQ17DRAFT_1378364 [Cyathus striatus]|nr:hypothetical protein BDQ17DRAFT_1378364 [Cyathus striatus]